MESRIEKKRYKVIFALFAALMIIVVFTPIVANAAFDYDSFPRELYEHIVVRNGRTELTRNVSFGILKFLAKGVTEIEQQLDTLLSYNILSFFTDLGLIDQNSFLISNRLVRVVFTIFLIIGAATLLVFRSKIKINDFLIGILTSAGMIIALPLFISSMNGMKTAGIADINNMDLTPNQTSDYVYSIGDELLSSAIIDVYRSGAHHTMYYYNTENTGGASTARVPGSVYSININSILNRINFDMAVVPSDPDLTQNNQTLYSTLTTADRMELIGLGHEYSLLVEAYNNGYADIEITRIASNTAEEMQMRASGYADANQVYSYNSFFNNLLYRVPAAVAARISGLSENSARLRVANATTDTSTFAGVLNCFDNELQSLLRAQNRELLRQTSTNVSDYDYRPLITENDYDNMGDLDSLWQNIRTYGYPTEYIYRYDYDFLPTFIILLASILCLIFAGLKLGNVMYDLVIVQLIAGIVIATDQKNGGRAKKTFQEILNCYLIFLLCALLIKIFFMLEMKIIQSNFSYFLKLILIIAFAKGTIDGPDFITKIIGTDAGVKSGAAAIMAINQGVNVARSVAAPGIAIGKRVAGGAAGAVSGMGTGAASAVQNARAKGHGIIGTAIGGIGGAVGGSIAGGVSGAFGSPMRGTAFERGGNAGMRFGAATGGAASSAVEKTGDAIKGAAGGAIGGAYSAYTASQNSGASKPVSTFKGAAGGVSGAVGGGLYGAFGSDDTPPSNIASENSSEEGSENRAPVQDEAFVRGADAGRSIGNAVGSKASDNFKAVWDKAKPGAWMSNEVSRYKANLKAAATGEHHSNNAPEKASPPTNNEPAKAAPPEGGNK